MPLDPPVPAVMQWASKRVPQPSVGNAIADSRGRGSSANGSRVLQIHVLRATAGEGLVPATGRLKKICCKTISLWIIFLLRTH